MQKHNEHNEHTQHTHTHYCDASLHGLTCTHSHARRDGHHMERMWSKSNRHLVCQKPLILTAPTLNKSPPSHPMLHGLCARSPRTFHIEHQGRARVGGPCRGPRLASAAHSHSHEARGQREAPLPCRRVLPGVLPLQGGCLGPLVLLDLELWHGMGVAGVRRGHHQHVSLEQGGGALGLEQTRATGGQGGRGQLGRRCWCCGIK